MLSFEVRKYLDHIRQHPSDALNPVLLKSLERSVDESAEELTAALYAPEAPLTWETRVILQGATVQSARQPLVFPKPVDVIGMYPSVIPITNTNGLITPTLDDIDVALDQNSSQYFSAGQGAQNAQGGTAGQFVTLASMGVQVPRLFLLHLDAAQPDFGMTFRWKRGTGIYQDAFVAVAVFARWRT
jgi:hypothetical protein